MPEHEPIASPQLAAYLASQPELPPIWRPPVSERRRERSAQVLRDSGTPERVASVEEVDAGGVPARLYRPEGSGDDVILWFHGGGWVLHDVATFDPLMRALANASRCLVLSLEYRLAPEHPFPAAVDDCWAATRWAADNYSRVAVAGDSAGANLATVAATRARDAGISLALQVLVYPIVDDAVDTERYYAHRNRYRVFAGVKGYGAEYYDGIRWLWTQYVPDQAQRGDPEACPLRASSLVGLAPALVITAEHDILRLEGEEYRRRLIADGVAADLIEYRGQGHGFLEALARLDDARDALDRIADAVNSAFASSARYVPVPTSQRSSHDEHGDVQPDADDTR